MWGDALGDKGRLPQRLKASWAYLVQIAHAVASTWVAPRIEVRSTAQVWPYTSGEIIAAWASVLSLESEEDSIREGRRQLRRTGMARRT